MTRFRSLLAVTTIALVAASASVASAHRLFHDLTGNWTFSVVTENGTGTPAVTLKQTGEKLVGTYESRMMGQREFNGTIKGDSVKLTLAANGPDGIALEFIGVVVDENNLAGVVDFGGMGGADFTGTRAP